MKYLITLLLLISIAQAQTVVTLSTADTSKIVRTTGTTNAELILRNSTRSVINGIAYNNSNGWIKYGIVGNGLLGGSTFRVDSSIFANKTWVNGRLLSYQPLFLGLQDSLTKKANRTFDNVAAGAIANAKLANSSLTIGSTNIVLGATSTTLAGLLSVTSTSFAGALTGNATTSTTATNLAGGSGGTIPYQSAAGTTTMLANGTAGYILQANGTTLAPTWVNPAVGTGYIDNQNGSTLSAQTAKFWITDTIKTSGKIIALGTIIGSNLSGTNTGDQTITLTSDVTGTGTGSFATTLATVNASPGTYGSATQTPVFVVNGKGLVTSNTNTTITPAVGSITGLGTGVATTLAINTGSAGAFQLNNGSGTGLTGVMLLASANTNTTAGALTTSPNLYTGSPVTGGTATTTVPLFYFNGGTSPVDWSTSGTYIGTNAVSGFVGNILDFHANGGTSIYTMTSTGAVSTKTAGLVSKPTRLYTGAVFTGGTGTTTHPFMYFNNGASAPTTWSTAGTYTGWNTVSGYTGNIWDAHINGGTSVASLNYQGNLTLAGTVNKVTITAPATSSTLTIADGSSLITSGAFANTLTTTGTTNVTLPTSGTLATLAGTETLSNKTFSNQTNFTQTSGIIHNAVVSSTSSIAQFYLQNTGGALIGGVNSSTGMGFTGGASAYSSAIGTNNLTDLVLFTNQSNRLVISSAGLISVPGLTASQLVQTDGSKNLVSSNTLPSGITLTTPVFSGVPTGTVTSGTYTPTLTNGINVNSSSSQLTHYIRLGNEVSVSGSFQVIATLGANTSTIVEISLPITSNFTDALDANGVANNLYTLGTSAGASVSADITGDLISINLPSLAALGSQVVEFSLHYTVK